MDYLIEFLDLLCEQYPELDPNAKFKAQREKRYFDTVLKLMHGLVTEYGDRESLSSYAFTVSNYIGGAISPRDIEALYRERYMDGKKLDEWGRIVKNVNTTKDVGVDEIKKQAAKFGNTVDRDGRPPIMASKSKNKKSVSVLESVIIEDESGFYTSNVLSETLIYEGFLDSAKQYLGSKYNKTIDDIQGDIRTFVDAGVLIKDIVKDDEYLNKVNGQLGKRAFGLFKQLDNQFKSGDNKMVLSIWNRTRDTLIKFINLSGWKGFLSRLGAYGILKVISVNYARMTTSIMEALFDAVTELADILPSLGLGPFFAIFETISAAKKYLFEILSDIRRKLNTALESATSGGTSAGGVATVPAGGLVTRRQPVSVNALDSDANIFGGVNKKKKAKKMKKKTNEVNDASQNMINSLQRQLENYQKRMDSIQKRIDMLRDRQQRAQGSNTTQSNQATQANQRGGQNTNMQTQESVKKMLQNRLEEKASSQAQQRAAAIALAVKKGDKPKSELKGASKEMYNMSKSDLEDFAKTKRKGLPKTVNK